MAIPAVPNFDKDRIPKEGTASFRADASYVWSTIPSVIDGINDTIVYINSTASQISIDKATVVNKLIAASQSEVNAKRSEEVATQKAREVLDYVIPEEATYNSAAIDTKNNNQNEAIFSGYGIVLNNNINEIRPQDIFVEVDVPNVVRLSEEAKQGQVRFTDGLHDMNPSDFALPPAPFAPEGTDELLDDKVNGLVCQTAHSKGDVVVTGNELVRFDSTASLGVNTKTSDTTEYFVVNITVIDGVEYVFTSEFNNIDATSVIINIRSNLSGSWATLATLNEGDNSLQFTSDGDGSITVQYTVFGLTGTTFNIDSASATLKDQSWIATRATVDMYDQSSTNKESSYIPYTKTDDVFYLAEGDEELVGSGTELHYYRRVGGNTSGTISGFNLDNNPSAWEDLGTSNTALTKLTNPFWKSIPQVTKQVALLVEKTSSGVILNTVKPLVNMYGEESVLTYETDIFTELGCTQVADRVWTDGGSEFILLTLRGYLNAGSTQTFFNTYGRAVKGANEGLTSGANSLYDSFVGQTGGDIGNGSGSSDGKLYDKTYIEGQGGLICFAIPNAKTPTYKHMEEIKRNLNDGYIEDGMEMRISKYSSNLGIQNGNSTWWRLSVSALSGQDSWMINDADYKGYVSIINVTVGWVQNRYCLIKRTASEELNNIRVYDGIDSSIPINTDFPVNGGDEIYFSFTTKSPYLATQGSHTYADLIGSPDNYPTELKNLLASGKSVGFMNALLVGQDGTDYTSIDNCGEATQSKKAVLSFEGTRINSGLWEVVNSSSVNTNNTGSAGVASIQTKQPVLLIYQAQNQSAIPVSTPQSIEHPDRDLIASNSHSKYAYNGLVYAGTGKVATGRSVESKSVENIGVTYDFVNVLDNGTYFNNLLLAGQSMLNNGSNDNSGIVGQVYERVTTFTPSGSGNMSFDDILSWKFLGFTDTTPTHDAITLDADSIVGVKALVTQTTKATQIFTQEMLYNVDWGDTDEFDSLTETTTTNLNGDDVQHKILYKPSSVRI